MNAAPLLIALFLLTTHVGIGWWCYGAGQDSEFARQAREEQLIAKATEGAQLAAASEIAKIKPINLTRIEKVEALTREVPVYRDAECQHPERVFDYLNAVLTGTEPAGGVELPGADPAP